MTVVPCVTTVEFFCGKALPKRIALPSCHESSLVFKRDMWWWLWQRVMKGLELDSKHTIWTFLPAFYVTGVFLCDHWTLLEIWSSLSVVLCPGTFFVFQHFIFVSYNNLGKKVASCNEGFSWFVLLEGKMFRVNVTITIAIWRWWFSNRRKGH